MPISKNTGGHFEENANANHYGGVEIAQSEQIGGGNTGNWTVTLKSLVPREDPFTVGTACTYNAKGTNNPNANNALVITQVVGPWKYKCTGPYPINT